MADQWEVIVQYLIDGTTHEKTFRGHRITSQVHGDRNPPRRANIRVHDKDGRVVETFQCDYQTVHRRKIDGSGT